MNEAVDIIVVGAGPVGLACALEAKRAGLRARVLDKGALVNSIVGYPARMEFFSTPDLIEIGGHPFPVQAYKPTREEGLEYYRGVTAREELDVRLYERVTALGGEMGDFIVETTRGAHRAKYVIVATGFFDVPNRLDVPGEDLPHVTHYYREPFPYVQQRVVVIGAKNSAAKAALETFNYGLASEVATEGIRVNAVSCGLIETGIHAEAGDASRLQRYATRMPMQRPGKPEEVAEAVVWLLSDAASYVTGAVLPVAGGR